MSKIDKSLSEMFGVDPMYEDKPTKTEQLPVVVDPESRAIQVFEDPDSTDMETDAAQIRNNLHQLINQGQEAFESLIHIAKTEEKISAFDIANQMLSNLSNINLQLLALHEKKKKMKMADQQKKQADKGQAGIVNNGGTTNIAFVGTTAELLDRIKKNPTDFLPSDFDIDDVQDKNEKE